MDVARKIAARQAAKPKHPWSVRLRQRLAQLDMTAADLARALFAIEIERSRRKLSKNEFAEEEQKLKDRVSSWTTGRVRHPRGETMSDVCRILNVKPSFFEPGSHIQDKEFFTSPHHRPIAAGGDFIPTSAPTIRKSAVPIRGRTMGGSSGALLFSDDDVVGSVDAPADVAAVPDVYAVYVVGDSMQPVYRPGNVLIVNPHLPPLPHDDVVIQISRDNGATVEGFTKRFVSMDDETVTLLQFNPEKTLTFPRAQVLAMHTVVYLKRR